MSLETSGILSLISASKLFQQLRTFFCSLSNTRMIKRRILEGIPWAINNQLPSLQVWDPHLKLQEIDFSSCSFWLQVHGLPLNQMRRQNAERIGQMFKKLINVDLASNHDVSIGSCLRMRVEVDITKPLWEGFTNKKVDGSLERVRFRYE